MTAPPHQQHTQLCPAKSLGWRHHWERELYPAPCVGPRLGLQLGGHPSFLPRWQTSSASP